jgi:hypothetical protein
MSFAAIAARIGEFRATASEIEVLADEAIASRDIDDLITVVRGLLDALDVVLAMASRLAAKELADAAPPADVPAARELADAEPPADGPAAKELADAAPPADAPDADLRADAGAP